MDALATESQFATHLAPVWHALPAASRGRFLCDPSLIAYVTRLGIVPVPVERPMREPAYPPPRFDGPPLLTASYGDIKVGRRLGYGPFVFIEHGAGQSYGADTRVMASYAGGPDRADNELILVPNQYSAERWRAAYPKARVEVVGCPKLDTLPRREPRARPGPYGPTDTGPVVAISFHFDGPNIPYGGTALPYYANQLAALAKRFTVIGHAHPKGDWPQRMARLYKSAGIPFVADFEDVCRMADIYICDNSSTIFEFASTGRPVVLLNAAHWSHKAGPGLRFWDAATVGLQVNRPADLIATVERALQDPPEQQVAREAALNFVYQPRTNGAAYAATAISDWLARRGEVAA